MLHLGIGSALDLRAEFAKSNLAQETLPMVVLKLYLLCGSTLMRSGCFCSLILHAYLRIECTLFDRSFREFSNKNNGMNKT